MKESPLILQGWGVRETIAVRKTQTRRGDEAATVRYGR